MCWQDLVISRRKKSKVYRTNSTVVIPSNGKRVGIWISATFTSAAQLIGNANGFVNTYAYCSNGFFQDPATFFSPPVFLSIDEIGDEIYKEFTLQDLGGSGVIAVDVWIEDPADVAKQTAME